MHRSTFQQIEDISIVLLRRIWCQSARKKASKEIRISSFYEAYSWKTKHSNKKKSIETNENA